jgi:hypothetical protein
MKPFNKGLSKFNLVYTSIILFIFLAFGGLTLFNFGIPGFNKNALIIFGVGSAISVGSVLVFGVFGVFNKVKEKFDGFQNVFTVGHVSESSDLLPFSKNPLTKFLPHLAWISVVCLMAVGGFVIWQEPDMYSEFNEFSVGDNQALAVSEFGLVKSVFDTAILPGFVEDMIAHTLNFVIVLIFLLILVVLKLVTKSKFFTINWLWYAICILFSSPMSAWFFMKAHTIVGGQNLEFLLSAWFFQTINLYVMAYTGFWFPLAHVLHNMIFLLGFSTAFSISLICVPLFIRKEWIYKIVRRCKV